MQSAAASALGATPLGGGAVQGARLARAWRGRATGEPSTHLPGGEPRGVAAGGRG